MLRSLGATARVPWAKTGSFAGQTPACCPLPEQPPPAPLPPFPFCHQPTTQQGSPISAPSLGFILGTVLRGLDAISGKLTDFTLKYGPADTSPEQAKWAVNVTLFWISSCYIGQLLLNCLRYLCPALVSSCS